jgi:hypothetical protein
MRTVKATITSILALGLLAGSAVGVAAQSTVVSGSVFGGCEDAEGGQVCTGGFVFDDDRLTGDYETTATEAYRASGDGFFEARVRTEVGSLTNDDGVWDLLSIAAYWEIDDEFTEEERIIDEAHLVVEEHWVLTGGDGYEGLTAYLQYGGRNEGVRGVIIEDAPPE